MYIGLQCIAVLVVQGFFRQPHAPCHWLQTDVHVSSSCTLCRSYVSAALQHSGSHFLADTVLASTKHRESTKQQAQRPAEQHACRAGSCSHLLPACVSTVQKCCRRTVQVRPHRLHRMCCTSHDAGQAIQTSTRGLPAGVLGPWPCHLGLPHAPALHNNQHLEHAHALRARSWSSDSTCSAACCPYPPCLDLGLHCAGWTGSCHAPLLAHSASCTQSCEPLVLDWS